MAKSKRIYGKSKKGKKPSKLRTTALKVKPSKKRSSRTAVEPMTIDVE